MPKHIHLTERQKRFISKLSLAPLTAIRPISRQTGIGRNKIQDIIRPSSNTVQTRFDLIERFEKDPKKHHLLDHPKLWALYRIKQLAPTRTQAEISAILKAEAKEKNARQKAQVTVPAGKIILSHIRRLHLRTPEETRQFRIQGGQKNRTRPKNNLPDATKQKLLLIGRQLVEKNNKIKQKSPQAEELQDSILDRLQYEIEYFDPRELTGTELEAKWTQFIRNRMGFFIADAFRKEIGHKTRYGHPRKAFVEDPDTLIQKEQLPARILDLPMPKFKRALTSTEKIVVEMIMQGMPRKEIAKKAGISTSGVSICLTRLRKITVK